jgi:hypothetical protein
MNLIHAFFMPARRTAERIFHLLFVRIIAIVLNRFISDYLTLL